MSLCGNQPWASESEFGLSEAAGLQELRGGTCEAVKSPLGGASDPSSEEQSARSCRSMVVRAERGEPETRTRRALSLSARARHWHPRQDIRARGRNVLLSRACPTHPARGTRGIAREPTRLTWQRSGLRVRGIFVHRHWAAAAATREELPRRGELAGHRNGEHGSAHGTRSVRTLPGTGPRPHLPLQLPGLDERPAPQLQHPVGADAVEGSASRRGACARLHPASPPASAQERGAGYSAAAAVAAAAIATHSQRSAGRLHRQARGRVGGEGWL